MLFLPLTWEGDGRGRPSLQAPLVLHKSEGPIWPGASGKHMAFPSSRFWRQPRSLQSTWHPFELTATKANANRAHFGGVLSVSFQSVCSCRHSFSCLIYFILKGLSVCITRTGGEKVSDVYPASLGLLFVIVRKKSPPVSGCTPDSPSPAPPGPCLPFSAGIGTSEVGMPRTRCIYIRNVFREGVADPFLLSIKYISFYHLMAWQQDHSSFK